MNNKKPTMKEWFEQKKELIEPLIESMKMTNVYQISLDKIKQEHIFIEDYLKGEIDLLQELVDKETPMKPNQTVTTLGDGKWINVWDCPRCERRYPSFKQNYCCMCGQKLDWSDTND